MMGDDLDKDWNLESAMAKLNLLNYGVLINFYVYVDDMNSTVNRIQVSGLSYATLDSYADTPLDTPLDTTFDTPIVTQIYILI